ncbi:hypothetical protein PoB_005361800 [Plakobranchus ocellatus]|uniref:Uncharacterized protein n=1 Tax=Plakobranchus ocellatus TaxID=259542 RepID=A0AAV4C5E5_9GAST|nr:hypothetical protein PoB_005361800 [Plakobranchus ocellatus]
MLPRSCVHTACSLLGDLKLCVVQPEIKTATDRALHAEFRVDSLATLPPTPCAAPQNSNFKTAQGTSVEQWLAIPPCDLQGPFCRGFEPRHRRPDLTEGHLIVDWLD